MENLTSLTRQAEVIEDFDPNKVARPVKWSEQRGNSKPIVQRLSENDSETVEKVLEICAFGTPQAKLTVNLLIHSVWEVLQEKTTVNLWLAMSILLEFWNPGW